MTSVAHELTNSPLGTTGIAVTRFSAGGHFTNGPKGHEDIPRRIKELHHLIDSGVTYFDVQWEPEELAMCEVMKARRDEITVAWPLHGCTRQDAGVTAEYICNYCRDHQRKYGIDHVDILLWVALELYPETQDRVMDEVRKGFERLKGEGFCDFLAFSCHHSPEMAMHAIRTFDDFAVMMAPYSPLHPAAGRELLPLAKEKGVGVVCMKPFGGGGGFMNKIWAGETGLAEMEPWRASGRPFQAAIQWVLSDPNVECTVPGVQSLQEINELLAVAEQPLGEEARELLDALRKAKEKNTVEIQLGDGAWD